MENHKDLDTLQTEDIISLYSNLAKYDAVLEPGATELVCSINGEKFFLPVEVLGSLREVRHD